MNKGECNWRPQAQFPKKKKNVKESMPLSHIKKTIPEAGTFRHSQI